MVGDRVVYLSRELRMPKNWGAPVLCDLGSAVVGDTEHLEDVQPDIYRAPEVVLEAPWSYQIDVWNTGCMVSKTSKRTLSLRRSRELTALFAPSYQIWDLFEGGHLFTGRDPEHQRYRSRAHLAEMIALLGQPPRELLNAGKSSHKFFTDTGKLDVARSQTICLFSWSLTRTLRALYRGFPSGYSTPGRHFARRQRDQPGRAESREVPRHDAEDAPVGAFEAFLGQGAGRGRMDHGAYVEHAYERPISSYDLAADRDVFKLYYIGIPLAPEGTDTPARAT